MGEEKGTTKIDNYQRVLRIDKNAGLERKFESIKLFNESFFRDNYYNAFALTQKILMRNNRMEEEKEWDIGQKKLYNIITFCGGRGSGKTSVMDSVIKALQDKPDDYENFIKQYNEGKSVEEKENQLDQLLKTYEFICMAPIDASLLEEKEDILDVILSKILQRVKRASSNMNNYYQWKTGNCCSGEDIYRLMEKIYRSRWQFQQRMDKRYSAGESSVEKLENLAGSFELRNELQKLINMCLQMLHQDKEKIPYLVISIDDLDLHVSAYEMLEQLHRYLMIPRVLIYLTVSEREIQSACKKHFEKIYESPEELSMSYLEKVLPYSRRIYLPATFSGDFFNVFASPDEGIKLDEELNLFGYPVKRFLLREIASRTWVFYDGCGLDTHFYEIDNLRTLINTYYLLESMKKYEVEELSESIVKTFKQCKEIFVRDYEKLRNDVVGRMANEKLNNPEQKRIFCQYYQEDFSSNGEYLVGEIVRLTDVTVHDYNYGELLGSLYMLSKKKEFKPLIQCILALATIELTQNYMYMFFMDDKNSREKWDEYISGSVIGSWGNQIFPKVKGSKGALSEIAYVKECMRLSVSLEISDIELKKQGQDQTAEEKREICRRLIEQTEMVETVMLFCALLTGKADVTLKISESQDEKLPIELSASEFTFDILGFVIHSMDCDKFVEKIKGVLLDALESYVDVNEKESDLKGEVENLIKNSSILKDYAEWDNKYKGAVLPVYSLDIMYNMLKQVKKKMEQEFSQEIDKKDFLKVLQTFYKHIGNYLLDEDLFYGSRTVTDKEIKEENQYTDFYGAFLNNPFVKCFIREKKAEEKTDEEKTIDGKVWKKPGPTTERPIKEFSELSKQLYSKTKITAAHKMYNE